VSTFAVTVERITVTPHENADALELAVVGGYRAVIAKGSFVTGDLAVYIPEQAVLPAALIEELGLTGKLAGPRNDRVRAVRLRGALSQGIVARPHSLTKDDLVQAFEQGSDLQGCLGITKWVPEVPAELSGRVIPAPDLIRWIDVENIKRFPTIFSPGEPVVATEKIHGSACCVTYATPQGDIPEKVLVSSKGFSADHFALEEDSENLYWRAARLCKIGDAAKHVAAHFGATRVGIFGEVYGPSTKQDLHYGLDHNEPLRFAAFDVVVEERAQARWLQPDEVVRVLSGLVDLVPVLYAGPYDYQLLAELAQGQETVSGSAANIREGVVVRANPERASDVTTCGRAIAKFVSSAYLTRKGGTEYE
jgi:RNA ligase (TIGR02306 family)